jgi:hypothetical protein
MTAPPDHDDVIAEIHVVRRDDRIDVSMERAATARRISFAISAWRANVKAPTCARCNATMVDPDVFAIFCARIEGKDYTTTVAFCEECGTRNNDEIFDDVIAFAEVKLKMSFRFVDRALVSPVAGNA